MKVKKTYLFIVALVLIILVLVIVRARTPKSSEVAPPNQQTPSELSPTPFSSVIPLNLETEYLPSSPITSLLNKATTVIPNQLPVYKISSTALSDREAQSIATQLGFSAAPLRFNDGRDGEVLAWSSQGATLRIVPSLRKVDYKTSSRAEEVPLEQKFSSDEQLRQIAQEFLVKNNLMSPTQLQFSKLLFFTLGHDTYELSTRNDSDYADVQFVESIGSYPILNMNAPGTIDVKLNRAGHIVSVFLDRTGMLALQGEYEVKTFEQLEASLAQATIQALNERTINPLNDPEVKVISVAVEKATIAYLQESSPTQQLLQPIFSLEGTATLNDGRTVPVLLYLPALKGQ